MQSFWRPFEPLPLALWDGADRTFSFFLILAQHYLFFLLLTGSSSNGIRRTSIGSETCIYLICHETKISITNSLNRTLCPKIWASYCSAEYCPSRQMQKRTLFSLDLPNLRQGQGSWICGITYPVHTRLHPQVFFTFLKVLKSTNIIYYFYCAF